MHVELPVKTTLLQNGLLSIYRLPGVELPVKTTLLQNKQQSAKLRAQLNYQLKRHCSKTATPLSGYDRVVELPVKTTLLQNHTSRRSD